VERAPRLGAGTAYLCDTRGGIQTQLRNEPRLMVVGQQHFGGLEPVADTYLAHIARRRSSRRSGNDSGARRREGRLVDVGSIVSPESRHRRGDRRMPASLPPARWERTIRSPRTPRLRQGGSTWSASGSWSRVHDVRSMLPIRRTAWRGGPGQPGTAAEFIDDVHVAIPTSIGCAIQGFPRSLPVALVRNGVASPCYLQ
jgi:hypothetical protein